MSKLTDSFRKIKIINAYDFAEHNQVVISYCRSNEWNVPRYIIYKKGFKIAQEFIVWDRKSKKAELERAKAWAENNCGIKEWAKTPFGDWMDKDIVASRIKELKARIKVK